MPALIVGAAITIAFGLLWIRDAARTHAPVDSAPPTSSSATRRRPPRPPPKREHLETYGRAGFLTLATIGLGGVIGAGVDAAVARLRGAAVLHR